MTRVEQCQLGTVFVCSYGSARHIHGGCKRTYLSYRDMEAHVKHRHRKKPEPVAMATSQQQQPIVSQSAVIAGGQTSLRVFIDDSAAVTSVATLLDRAKGESGLTGRGAIRLGQMAAYLPGGVGGALSDDFPVGARIKGGLRALWGVRRVEEVGGPTRAAASDRRGGRCRPRPARVLPHAPSACGRGG